MDELLVQNHIAHLQNIPNNALGYHLCTLSNVGGVQVTSVLRQKASLFDPHMTQGGKMKILNHYCTSVRHTNYVM